jgi:hypothetical protein
VKDSAARVRAEPSPLPSSQARGEGIKACRELLVAWVLLTAALLVQLLGTRQLDLFRHGLWLDETITWLITNDASFPHAIAAVRGGVDTNPPTVYALLWPMARALGGLDEIGLHVFSFLSVTIALTGLCAICRRFFDPLPSALGALVAAAHPTVLGQALEARFYGAWLAATVWFAYAQMISGDSANRGATVGRCALGVMAATIHWFGAIAVAMIVVTDLIAHHNPSRLLLRRALPGICAMVALAACAPFYLGQRAGLTVVSWIDPLTLADIKRELTQALGPMTIVFVVVASFLARVIGWREDSAAAQDEVPKRFRELAPIASLLLFPIVIVIFSLLVQPALKERYIIVGIAPLAPLAAWLTARLSRIATMLILAGVFAIGAAELVAQGQSFRGKEDEWRRVLEAIDTAPDPLRPLIFKRRHELYPLLRLRPELLARSAMLDFDGQPSPDVTPLAQYERDMSRKVTRFYPQFRIAPLEELRKGGPIYVISPIQEQFELAALIRPYFNVEPRAEWIYDAKPK